jgi:hypothetical protein
VTLAGLMLTPAVSVAQDAHYSTFQYGPRSSLLGGAVIGSVDDVSGVYYNPGALGLADDLAFAFSTNVFEVSGVTLEDGGGDGIDLGTSKSGIRPSLIAGTITRNLFDSKGILAYSILTRARGDQDLAGQFAFGPGDLPDSLNIKDLTGQAIYEGRFSDTWAGLTYSHRVGSGFGLGVSWYGASRTQNRRITTTTTAVRQDTVGGSAFEVVDGKYSTLRTLLKLGAFAETGPITAGVTFTTPSLQISGSGGRSSNDSFNTPDSLFVASNVQLDIGATYKTPMSIGFGLGWRIGNARLHGSAEYFDKVEPYKVLDAEPFLAQEPDTVLVTPQPIHAASEVFNWGAGGEYEFSTGLKAYASFYTDNSSLADGVDQSALSIMPFDIRTITAGVKFVVGSALFTLGGGYGWGSQVDQSLTDLIRDENNDLEATYVYRNFRLLFGFEVGVE